MTDRFICNSCSQSLDARYNQCVVGHQEAPHGSHPFLKCASTSTSEVPMSNVHADAFNYGKSLLKL